jgi:hypothetical protein
MSQRRVVESSASARDAFEARFGTQFGASLAAVEDAERDRQAPQVRTRVDVDRTLLAAALRSDYTAHSALREAQSDRTIARKQVEMVRAEAAEARVKPLPAQRVGRELQGQAWTQHARQLVAEALIDAYQNRGKVHDKGARGGEFPEPAVSARYGQKVAELADYFQRLIKALDAGVEAGLMSRDEATSIQSSVVQATFRDPSERVSDGYRAFAKSAIPALRADVSKAMDERTAERAQLQLQPIEPERGASR